MKFFLLILTSLLIVSPTTRAAELKPYSGGMQASEFLLKDIQGKTHRLSQYRGKVVLLNFWASWCPPCVEELPSLQRLQKHYQGKEFAIITIDVGEPADRIKLFLKQVNATALTVLLDTEGSSHQDWSIYVFPTNFLLDKNATIRYAAVGALVWDEPAVIDIINKLLE